MRPATPIPPAIDPIWSRRDNPSYNATTAALTGLSPTGIMVNSDTDFSRGLDGQLRFA